MDCLKTLIGINAGTCGSIEGTSGVNLTSLAGCSLDAINGIANSEQVNYHGVYNDIVSRAIPRFKTMVAAKLSAKYRLKNLLKQYDLGRTLGSNVTAMDEEYRGFTILKNTLSYFNTIYIENVKLYLTDAVDVPIKIFDVESGEIVFEKTFSGVAGWNTFKVAKHFTAKYLFVSYDASNIDSTQLPVDEINVDGGIYGSWDSVGGYGLPNDCTNCLLLNCDCVSIRIKGANGLIASLNEGIDTYGLSATFSTRCSYDALVCNNTDLFTSSFLYLLGSEYMLERMTSGRLNEFTTLNIEDAEKFKGIYDAEFEKELEMACKGINFDLQLECCIDCNSQVIVQDWLP